MDATSDLPATFRKPRWWWNGQDLVEDGKFELRRRYDFEKWFLIDFMMG